ncbi:MAG: Fic family protein [Thaumarchaeota archaeon]|nr:Fic family protein [Nitrososphaerota archaeon]
MSNSHGPRKPTGRRIFSKKTRRNIRKKSFSRDYVFTPRYSERRENEVSELKYPTSQDLISLNKQVVDRIKVRKADRHNVLSLELINWISSKTRDEPGDAYDKASFLLIEIVQKHPFDSANRRTAYAAAKAFLESNDEEFAPVMDPKVMLGIREGFYTKAEIKNWLKTGEIKEFQRFR